MTADPGTLRAAAADLLDVAGDPALYARMLDEAPTCWDRDAVRHQRDAARLLAMSLAPELARLVGVRRAEAEATLLDAAAGTIADQGAAHIARYAAEARRRRRTAAASDEAPPSVRLAQRQRRPA
jgi:hypothetical protein